MSDIRGKLVAYAELARATNVPTVVSNVIAGAGLGVASMARGAEEGAAPLLLDWVNVGLLALGVSLLYIAGMVLNGIVDLDEDARARPGRPLPSGRVKIGEAWGLCGLALAGGVAAVMVADVRTWLLVGVLVVCIVVYNVWRRAGKRSVAVMGACRGVVYPLAALGAGANRGAIGLAVGVGVIVGVYTVVLSLVARDEVEEGAGRKGIAWGLAWIVVIAGVVAAWGSGASYDEVVLIVVALAGMVWVGGAARAATKEKPEVQRAVLGAISGFCLVDGLVLVAAGMTGAACVAYGCFVLTVAGHRRLSGT
jgi:4-hydroxybenzoate polyprenyltransferase